MSEIIGLIGTSHVPAIGAAIGRGLQQTPYWKPFFDGFAFVHRWLAEQQPDVAVIVYNDHGLNFFLNQMPTFAIGAAPRYATADEGWGIPMIPPVSGDPALSWDIIEGAVHDEFDVVTCQEMLIDHAVTVPLQLLWPDQKPPVRIVPVAINTVQHPLPSAKRCLAFGRAIGKALRASGRHQKIVVVATGGLSHQLDGQRAGFVNPQFDAECLDCLVHDPDALAKYSNEHLVRLAGTQGIELLNWIVGRGIIGNTATEIHRSYHIPISNTASAVQVLQAA